MRCAALTCVYRFQSPVHDAARSGSEKSLRLLKDEGANMVIKTGNGSTPLHYAAQYDKIDAVKYLLNLDEYMAKGVVDIANASGQTALHVAARHGKDKSVEQLLAFNANTLLLDKIGRTAESVAKEQKYVPFLVLRENLSLFVCHTCHVFFLEEKKRVRTCTLYLGLFLVSHAIRWPTKGAELLDRN